MSILSLLSLHIHVPVNETNDQFLPCSYNGDHRTIVQALNPATSWKTKTDLNLLSHFNKKEGEKLFNPLRSFSETNNMGINNSQPSNIHYSYREQKSNYHIATGNTL